MLNYKFIDNNFDETIVILHGFLADMNSLNDVSHELSKTMNVLAIDLPGFGESELESIDVSYLDVLERVKAVIDGLKLKQLHLFGYSMGGRIGSALLCYYPTLFKSAILESTSLGINDEKKKQERFNIDLERATQMMNDFDRFLSEWEKMPLFESEKRLAPSTYQYQKENRESQDPVLAARSLMVYGTGVQPFLGDLFLKVDIPILLIVGESDEKFVTINTAIDKKHPRTSLVIVDDAAHNVHLEQKEAFLSEVNLFLQQVKEN